MGNKKQRGRKKRMKRREEEIAESLLAAAAVALLVSGINKIIQYIHAVDLMGTPPHPLLFLLLHLIVATIVITSVRPTNSNAVKTRTSERRLEEEENNVIKQKEVEEEESSDGVEEVDARAEAFILAFRHQLRLDSFGSRGSGRAQARRHSFS